MAYARELDELRQEVRQGAAGTVVFWPKIDGANVLASSTAGHATFEVFKPDGTSIEGPSNFSPTTVDDISKFSITISAISDLDEDYYVKIVWRQNGTSVVRNDYVYFDVVLWPFGGTRISLNDLLEERPDVGLILDRHGVLLGYATGDTAKETAAAIYSVKAAVELDALIRSTVASDAAAHSVPDQNSTGYVTQRKYTRPNLILNRNRLVRVERYLAMREIYKADCNNPEDDEEESAGLYRTYRDLADQAWSMVGPLKYDAVEDMAPDDTLTELGKVFYQRRVQS